MHMYMYAYMMHIIDYFTSYWDPDACIRYNKYKREQILAQNRKAYYKRKLAKFNLTNNEYKSVKEYVKNEINCSSDEVDEILTISLNSGIDLSIPRAGSCYRRFPEIIEYTLKSLKININLPIIYIYQIITYPTRIAAK